MAITQAIPTSAKKDWLDGVHLAANTYKMALYVSTANLDATTTAYTATGEVASGGGYTTTGVALTGRATSTSGTKAVLTFTSPTWTSSTITARGALIYNDTAAGKNAVAVFNFGSDISSTNGTFTVTVPTADGTTGLIRIA